MSYLANREKNSDENNTVSRYRADSKKISDDAENNTVVDTEESKN